VLNVKMQVRRTMPGLHLALQHTFVGAVLVVALL
jgi:hypothetical protein